MTEHRRKGSHKPRPTRIVEVEDGSLRQTGFPCPCRAMLSRSSHLHQRSLPTTTAYQGIGPLSALCIPSRRGCSSATRLGGQEYPALVMGYLEQSMARDV